MKVAVSRRAVLAGGSSAFLAGCANLRSSVEARENPLISFEPFEPQFASVVDIKSSPRLLGEGYRWAEGPAWDKARQALYFTDVPANTAYRWSSAAGTEIFLHPSGGQASVEGFREPGANGLLVDRTGRLILCNHGERSLESLDVTTRKRRTLASTFEGKRFSSPNDVIEAANGTLYFTDPPYGLEGLDASPLKEMEVNGVYRLLPDGDLSRIASDLTFPNGVSLSPDGSRLFISQSDPADPRLFRLDLEKGEKPEPWFDAGPYMDGYPGLPDGMAMAADGHLFLAGPGGVLVLDADANCLGRIGTGRATANCTFGEDGRTLFITAQDRLLAVRTKVVGLGYQTA